MAEYYSPSPPRNSCTPKYQPMQGHKETDLRPSPASPREGARGRRPTRKQPRRGKGQEKSREEDGTDGETALLERDRPPAARLSIMKGSRGKRGPRLYTLAGPSGQELSGRPRRPAPTARREAYACSPQPCVNCASPASRQAQASTAGQPRAARTSGSLADSAALAAASCSLARASAAGPAAAPACGEASTLATATAAG